MRLTSTWQSELLHDSPKQEAKKKHMHRGVLELCMAWCARYHIGVGDWWPKFSMAHCKVATQVYQKDVLQFESLQGLWAMPKWEMANMTPLLQCTKRWRRSSLPPTIWNMGFCFFHDDIKHYVSGNKFEYVVDWLIVPNTWPLKIGINMSREKVSALEYVMFQLQQEEAFSPHCRPLAIEMLPNPWLHFWVSLNPNVHPTSKFSKAMHHNPTTLFQ